MLYIYAAILYLLCWFSEESRAVLKEAEAERNELPRIDGGRLPEYPPGGT